MIKVINAVTGAVVASYNEMWMAELSPEIPPDSLTRKQHEQSLLRCNDYNEQLRKLAGNVASTLNARVQGARPYIVVDTSIHDASLTLQQA